MRISSSSRQESRPLVLLLNRPKVSCWESVHSKHSKSSAVIDTSCQGNNDSHNCRRISVIRFNTWYWKKRRYLQAQPLSALIQTSSKLTNRKDCMEMKALANEIPGGSSGRRKDYCLNFYTMLDFQD